MTSLQELYNSFLNSLEDFWESVLSFMPNFLSALLVLILGLILSGILGELARKLVRLTKVDQLVENIGLKEEVREWGMELNLAALAEWLVKWFFYIVTIFAVVDILNIEQLSSFMEQLVLYLPNVLIAVIIMAVGLIAGRLLHDIVVNSTRGAVSSARSADFLGNIAKWSVFIFSLMAALVQLGVATSLIQILFTGLVGMLALAGGLAFGFGGREHAARVLDGLGSRGAVNNPGKRK